MNQCNQTNKQFNKERGFSYMNQGRRMNQEGNRCMRRSEFKGNVERKAVSKMIIVFNDGSTKEVSQDKLRRMKERKHHQGRSACHQGHRQDMKFTQGQRVLEMPRKGRMDVSVLTQEQRQVLRRIKRHMRMYNVRQGNASVDMHGRIELTQRQKEVLRAKKEAMLNGSYQVKQGHRMGRNHQCHRQMVQRQGRNQGRFNQQANELERLLMKQEMINKRINELNQ